MLRLLGLLITVLTAIAVAILTWPQFFRLERTFPIAQIVSLRAVTVVLLAVLGMLFLLLCLARPLRAFAGTMAAIAFVGAVAGGGILIARGVGSGGLPETTEASVRVMTWNTAGGAADAETIARTAVAMQADIVSLPETTEDVGIAVAVAMRDLGAPMWVHNENYEGWDANWTSVLISPDLGDYAVVESTVDGTTNTSEVPSVVAMPVDGNGPIVVAVHAVAPRQAYMADWRSDLQWLADQCATDSVIMAGDFNATLDHMANLGVGGADLGRCHDGAAATGTGGVGTWTTSVPSLLGTPIDHVLSTSGWVATGSVVLTSLDDSGSDHRPLVVQLEPAA
ncbi:endonuclease/exonuclease/phosphatase family protein [Microbacterium memoriense]|uniref:Endonuclease/exonuclease/phosphatase family protein n=1 Tax=Microbacterium memoriense TaxID=2978350 RepID=A0ABT2PA01_9MICO|nr:endonuclease/exonuclease/phosphatase family protein [Microbacterium memoriense]MCT9001413.1 endonuclease/exonuclease/phosphatase family protein [Microbacterium memoriense]